MNSFNSQLSHKKAKTSQCLSATLSPTTAVLLYSEKINAANLIMYLKIVRNQDSSVSVVTRP